MSRRAAIYARFSSHNQRSESIEIQVENCRAYCQEHDLKVVATYADYAQSGRTSERAEFQRMLADASKRLFDAVVIYKVTRIMRNRDEMAIARLKLAKWGVKILYAGEDIPEGSGGVLQLGLLEVLAEYESALTAERIRDGIQKNAERCMANGHTLYGWDIVDGRYVVNESERAVLTRIKDAFLGGMSLQAAIDSAGPHKTKRGAPLRVASVAKMLKRVQNIGTYSYAGHVEPGGMPALWSEEEHKKLLARFERRANPMKTEHTVYYPLSLKMKDANCSRYYTGEQANGGSGKVYHYYRCKECGRSFRKEALEQCVADAVIAVLSDEKERERVAHMVVDFQFEEEDPTPMSTIIQAEIDDIDKAFASILSSIEKGLDIPGTKERVAELKEQRASLEEQLADAKRVESVQLTYPRVLYWLETMADKLSPEKICSTFVHDVTVDDDALHIRFLFDEPESSSKSPQLPSKRQDEPASDQASSSESPLVELGREQTNSVVYSVSRGFVIVAHYHAA